jgi:hypothetical protein
MGSLKCRIVIKKGVINVLNIDGTPSELYQEALLLTGNQDQALNLWQTAYSDDFIAEYGTNNKDQMSLDDVLKYLDTHNASSKNLNKEQREAVTSIMEANGISTLSDLQNKLTKIFKPNGILEVDTKAAVKSKLYTEEDIRDLDVESIKGLLDAIEGELVRSDIEIEPKTPTKLVDTSRKNALGGSERITLEQVEENIKDSIEDFQNPKSIKDAIESSPYAEAITPELKKKIKALTRIPVVSIVNGVLTAENKNTATTVANTLQETYATQDVNRLKADLEQLSELSPETLAKKPEATVKLLKEIEAEYTALGIDLIGISNHPSQIENIKALLDAGIRMVEFGSVSDIETFSKLKDAVIEPTKNSIVTNLSPIYKGLTIVRLDTQVPLDTLYREYNLIKVGENLFHKVSANNKVSELYEALYEKALDGELKLNTRVDYKLPENKKEVISKVLPEFVAKQSAKGYTTSHEMVVLHQLLFDHVATKPAVNKSARLAEIKTDPEYLKDDFVTDFYKYILEEKAKDSFVYREVLSAFAITDNDISLRRRIDSIEGIIPRQELEDYIRLKKDTEMDHLLPATTGVRNDILHTLNNLEDVKTYSKPTRMIDGHVITEANNKNFIKVEGDFYRQSVRNAEVSVYTKIEPKPGVYNTTDTTNYYNEKEVADVLEKSKGFFAETKSTTEEQKDIVKELEPKVKAKPATDKQVTQLVSEYLKERLGSDISILSEEDMRKELNKLGYDSLQAMIIGEKGADENTLGDLVLAKGLSTIGVSHSTIKRLTGWEYSNGFWKYELPEPKFKLENVEEGKEYKLSDVIDAEDLINMYPEYKETKVIFKNESTSAFNGDTNTIRISTKDEPYTTFTNGKESLTFVPGESKRVYRLGSSSKRNFAHELSHAQQWQEGFYRGGSPTTIGARAVEISGINKADKESVLREKLQTALDNKDLSQSDRNVVQAILDSLTNSTALYQAYQNIVGEIEARNIENRINLTPEKRINTTLASTEDNISEKDRIKFLEANDKVYGFYNPATDKIYLTEEFLNSGTLLHEHWHAFKPALKEKAEAGDKTAKLILDRMSALVNESGAFNEAEFSARYDAANSVRSEWAPGREGKGDKKILERNNLVQQAAKDLKAGKITNEDYRSIVKANSPIAPITTFFAAATKDQIVNALDSNKVSKVDTPVQEGKMVALRLDIPAYQNHNTWVVTVHDAKTNKDKGGSPISYLNVARVTNVTFNSSADRALKIATGSSKDSFIRINGNWKNFEGATLEDKGKEAEALVDEIKNNPEWVQVGTNPFRQSFFYDRANGIPVKTAEEVVQVGGLVYAKNVEYGDINDPEYTVKGLKDAAGKPVQFSAESYVYHGGDLTEGVEGPLYTSWDQSQSEAYARGNEGGMYKFNVDGLNIISEEDARSILKEGGISPAEGWVLDELNLHEIIDPRFDTSISEEDLTRFAAILKEKEIDAIKFTDTNVLTLKEDISSLVVFNSSKLTDIRMSTNLSSEAYNPRPGESKQDYIDRMREEVEANLLGANGEEYFKRIAKENKLTEEATKSFLQKIKDFIGQFSDWLANQLGFGNMTPKEAAKLSTKDLLDRVTTTMLRGDFILDKINKDTKNQSNETDKIVKLQAIGFRFITPVTKKDVENISCD